MLNGTSKINLPAGHSILDCMVHCQWGRLGRRLGTSGAGSHRPLLCCTWHGELVMNMLNDLTSTCTWDGKLMMKIQNRLTGCLVLSAVGLSASFPRR